MAYYATLNAESIVTNVFPGKDNGQGGVSNWETEYSKITGKICKATSYNSTFRKNFAGIGYTYDATRDAFIPPIPGPAQYWALVEQTCQWTQTAAGAEFYIGEAVRQHLDTVVGQRQYDSILSAISYANSTNAQWSAEGTAAKTWRDAVWAKVYEIMAQVQSGQRPIPSVTEVINELPVIQWPA